MTAIDLLTHPLAQRLTWTLVHFVWQGAAIAVALVVVVEAFRVRSVHARYALSLAALVAMVTALPVTFLALGETFTSDSQSTTVLPIASIVSNDAAEAIPSQRPVESTFSAYMTDWLVTLQPALFLLWLLGCLLLNARIVVGWLATQGLLRSRERLSPEVSSRLARLGSRFQLRISDAVFVSSRVTQALAVGFLKPVVLLPAAWLSEIPPQFLEAIVAHELAHLRRCDLWVNLLQRLAEAVLFYHPALWWLSARLRRERELCCDELAVAATGRRLEYAEALELTARWAAVEGRPALAAGFFGDGKMNLLNRVRCVLGISAERPASLWPASLLLGGLSLALLAAVYSANTSAVNADDEKPVAKDAPKERAKEGERREGEVRRDGDKPAVSEADRFLGRVQAEQPRRDGDRPRPEGEVRRDGDRPRPEGTPRDGERKPEERRPDQPRPASGREGAPRDGDARRPVPAGEMGEMMAIIRQLRAEVAELRQEVARLRGDKVDGPRRPGAEGERREGDRPRPDAVRPRPDAERREGADRPRPEGERREGGDRPKAEGERREGAERPKAEGDRK
jgi:beta-lactamase regulating signal transducer with metallopeptidase domain